LRLIWWMRRKEDYLDSCGGTQRKEYRYINGISEFEPRTIQFSSFNVNSLSPSTWTRSVQQTVTVLHRCCVVCRVFLHSTFPHPFSDRLGLWG
jgi:hypothetical protein